jgi:hypothetical protein
VQYLFNGLAVEVAQHVGIASTAGFDITTGIDMQATPGGCTVEIAHALFTSYSRRSVVLVDTLRTIQWLDMNHCQNQPSCSCVVFDASVAVDSPWPVLQCQFDGTG